MDEKRPKNKSHKKDIFYSRQDLMNAFGLTETMIERYFPKPSFYKRVRRNGKTHEKPYWREKIVYQTLSKKEVKEAIRRIEQRRNEAKRKEEQLKYYLEGFTPERMFEQARELKRHFILHIGPTNSGKTHDAIEELKRADTGTYLGPLRLLALEMYDRMNADGCLCNLLTGEEREDVEGALITSSTIELCDYEHHYQVAVIDEAQMIADPDRGSHWTKAICLVNADRVHLCMAPEAENLICGILDAIGAEYEIVRHERLVPLTFSGHCNGLNDVQDGDAIITFSRKGVLKIAAHLEQLGHKASVIYGALPPAARREEVRRFSEHETDTVVATDAIGMGISLPIHRIIFADVDKYDGQHHRFLRTGEIRQIAGRAGRFGIYDHGYVLTMHNSSLIRHGLEDEPEQLKALRVPFPKEALEKDFALKDMLEKWQSLPPSPGYMREDVSSAAHLLKELKDIPKDVTKKFVYDLISCPVDIKSNPLVDYWKSCSHAILYNKRVPDPPFAENSLESCELQYRAYDIHHQLLRRIGIEEDCLEEKEALCNKINEFLKQDKKNYIHRCRECGKELDFSYKYDMCQACYDQLFGYWPNTSYVEDRQRFGKKDLPF